MPYVLTEDQIRQYSALKDKESLQEIEDLIPSLEESLSAIGDELTKYLKEAGEVIKEEKKEKKEPEDKIFTPFASIFKGMQEIFSRGKTEKKISFSRRSESVEKQEAETLARTTSFVLYDVFKKVHGMLSP